LRSYWRSVRGIVFEPIAYFRAIDPGNGLLAPLTFAIFSTIGPWMILLCVFLGLQVSTDGMYGPVTFYLTGVLGNAVGVLVVLATPILFVALLLFSFVCVFHLVVLLVLRGRSAGFRATFRANAYASVGMLMCYIPFIGGLLFFYGFYLVMVGIRELHSTSTTRAVIITLVSIPITLVMIGYGLGLLGSLLGL
jgi:hypothetical protein